MSVPFSRTTGVGLTRDFRLVSQFPIFQRFTYDALQYTPIALDEDLPYWMRQDNLAFPIRSNPVAQQMAKKWRAYYGSDAAYIAAVLRWF